MGICKKETLESKEVLQTTEELEKKVKNKPNGADELKSLVGTLGELLEETERFLEANH